MKKYVHAGLNLVAAMFVVAGLIAIFQYHNEQNYSHLNSIHSWLGILTALLIFVQVSSFDTHIDNNFLCPTLATDKQLSRVVNYHALLISFVSA